MVAVRISQAIVAKRVVACAAVVARAALLKGAVYVVLAAARHVPAVADAIIGPLHASKALAWKGWVWFRLERVWIPAALRRELLVV
tara:strand:+ start:336 stop:593 length:258 start_codon:yes stop_codon:yes gene_type:complete